MINSVYELCKKYSDNVYFSLLRQDYGRDKIRGSGEVCTPMDYENVISSDYLIFIAEDSMGCSIELGWASNMKKKVLTFIDKNYHQSELYRFINTITPTMSIEINTSEGYGKMKNKILNNVEEFFKEF
jgi:hypothetical protein